MRVTLEAHSLDCPLLRSAQDDRPPYVRNTRYDTAASAALIGIVSTQADTIRVATPHRRGPLCGADAHDGAGDGVRRARRHAELSGEQNRDPAAVSAQNQGGRSLTPELGPPDFSSPPWTSSP